MGGGGGGDKWWVRFPFDLRGFGGRRLAWAGGRECFSDRQKATVRYSTPGEGALKRNEVFMVWYGMRSSKFSHVFLE